MANPEKVRIALAQINATVGDIDGNARLIEEHIARARDKGAGAVVFPELSLPGYPAEDLYLKRHFLAENVAALERLARSSEGIDVIVGFAEPIEGAPAGRPDGPSRRPAHNSVAVLAGGRIAAVYRKQRLPNYAVFDEARYFEPGSEAVVAPVAGIEAGLTICEDLWEPGGPAVAEVGGGARLILNPSASPYLRGKPAERERMFAERAREHGVPIACCNLVGGQDDLVFDGSSFAVGADGELIARARPFEDDLLIVDLPGGGRVEEPLGDLDEVYAALVLGLREYVEKNGFRSVILGLSGGIDSALVALLAVDALGPERVAAAVMPSPHSSAETQDDARRLAGNLGIELLDLPIGAAMDAYDRILAAAGGVEGLAAENVQARIRGNLLMAVSNSRGSLVLATGNKSETSVGYSTLYGDMAGGLSVIKDVPKQLVYDLVRHRNASSGNELVPATIIERPPSAELRPDQRDEDSLPPYDLLDRVLEGYVQRDLSRDELVASGLPAGVVDEVVKLVNRAEYKRRQAAPGIRITSKAFGRDRRLPITNRYPG